MMQRDLRTEMQQNMPLPGTSKSDFQTAFRRYFGYLKTAPFLQHSLQWYCSSDKVYSLLCVVFTAGNNSPSLGV